MSSVWYKVFNCSYYPMYEDHGMVPTIYNIPKDNWEKNCRLQCIEKQWIASFKIMENDVVDANMANNEKVLESPSEASFDTSLGVLVCRHHRTIYA